MAISFREVAGADFGPFSAGAPDGAIIGVIGADSPGLERLLRLATGLELPASGELIATEPRRFIGLGGALNLGPAGTLALHHALASRDALVRFRVRVGLERLRRGGATILLLSHEQDLLREISDELWWVHQGSLAARGDAREVLAAYNRHVTGELRQWAASVAQPLAPSMRRGDGRAEILALQTLDSQGRPTIVWNSGELASVRVTVRFNAPVQDPVVGIMIRTRIGFEVFGTNTELEGVRLGPVSAGDTRTVLFGFQCHLCPQEYTLTAASHDPDGVWHDWMEDAVAFSVTAPRYTAGVADLRAAVKLE
jgi:lipopolysaccharide transport system ATP-binding protein